MPLALARASALVAVAVLTGCISAPPTRQKPANEAPAFSMNGRLLATDGGRRFNAALRWSQANTTRILLTTPLGQALASIDVDANGARLTTAEGRSYAASSLSELARRGLGLTLPLEHLPWWLNGRPAPDAPSEVSEDGFLQLGWTVRYSGRDARGRPLRLDAECLSPCGAAAGTPRSDGGTGSEGAQSGPPSVRLIIDQWLEP